MESVKNFYCTYKCVCVCVLNGARSRGVVDKWVDDDPAAGQSEYVDAVHVHTPVKENGRRGRSVGGP